MKAIKNFFMDLVDGAKAVARIVKATLDAIKLKPGHMSLLFTFVFATTYSIAPNIAEIENRANALKDASAEVTVGHGLMLNIDMQKKIACSYPAVQAFFGKGGYCDKILNKGNEIPPFNLAEFPEANREDFPGMVISGIGTAFGRAFAETNNITKNQRNLVVQKENYHIIMGLSSPLMLMPKGKVLASSKMDPMMYRIAWVYMDEHRREIVKKAVENNRSLKYYDQMPTLA